MKQAKFMTAGSARLLAGVLAAALCPFAAVGDEAKANQLFGALAAGSHGEASPIGSYAKGCLAGGVQLPETGPTWQAMRLSRNRNWGHPVLIDYIIDLSETAAELGWKGLYVGDLSQPRGGPMTSGHRSHQIGLDVDLWMLPPERLDLTEQEREDISSISIRTPDQKNLSGNWTQTHMEVLKAAAKHPMVDRIFVTAPAKIFMCENAGEDREWLQRIRPLYGHHYHFHVRLKCPSGSTDCITQTPTVAELSKDGDGCDATLRWWVTGYLEELKKPRKEPAVPVRGVRDYTMADLPEQCMQVLASN